MTETAVQSPTNAQDRVRRDDYISIKNLVKTYDDFYAVDGVNLDIKESEIFALLGSSGCGKSTLLRMLAGFETPTQGNILIDGVDMQNSPPYSRPVNMMFQSYALFPHMTIEKNVAFGLKQDGVEKDEIEQRVTEVLNMVEMTPFKKHKPHQLSGGQRQRTALARSLVKRPKLLLLDEPMAALDKKLRQRTQFELVNILESVGVTCIIVTHDQEEAMVMAHRIGIMDQGQIKQIGSPFNVYEHPNSRFIANFVGSANIIEGTVIEDEVDHVIIASSEIGCTIYVGHGVSGEIGRNVGVMLRPEKISLSLAPIDHGEHNWCTGKVKEIAYIGDHSIYHVVTMQGKRLAVTVTNRDRDASIRPTWNQKVYISWSSGSPVVLEA